MELIIDNIQMVHMNSKLIEYCKQQAMDVASTKEKLEETNEIQMTSSSQAEEKI